MWRPLNDSQLVSAYVKEFPGSRAPAALVKLLEALRTTDCDGNVFAVTSLGSLWFTTAPDYTQADKHPSVSVLLRGDGFSVSYVEAGKRRATSGGITLESGLEATVRAFLLRMVRAGRGG